MINKRMLKSKQKGGVIKIGYKGKYGNTILQRTTKAETVDELQR